MSNSLLPGGHGGERLFQAFAGAEIGLAGGRLPDAEHLGRLGCGQLLEMLQGQELPIQQVEVSERLAGAAGWGRRPRPDWLTGK